MVEKTKPTLNKVWNFLLLMGIAGLAITALDTLSIKIPDSNQTASTIDAITGTIPTEPTPEVPADSIPVTVISEPTPAELTSITPTDIPNFTETLQIVTDSVEKILDPVPIEPAPISITKGVSRLNLKVFVQAQDILESTVNEWFSVQKNIVVDQLNVQDYGGGGYLVTVSYHMGGTGNSPTRLKIIAGENSEADAQAFLSSLGASQTVRSVSATTSSYPKHETTVFAPIIFIVYE